MAVPDTNIGDGTSVANSHFSSSMCCSGIKFKKKGKRRIYMEGTKEEIINRINYDRCLLLNAYMILYIISDKVFIILY